MPTIKRCAVDWQTEPIEAIRPWFDFGDGFYKWGRRKFSTLEFMEACDYADKVMDRFNRIFGEEAKDV